MDLWMMHENAEFDATCAAAAGDDPALLAELRAAFSESVARQLDLMKRARCDGNWIIAALRLKAIAASFHAKYLIGLAEEALDGAPGDPVVLRKIDAFVDALN